MSYHRPNPKQRKKNVISNRFQRFNQVNEPNTRFSYNNVIQYNESFVYNLQRKVKRKLSSHVLAILFTDCTIRRTMSENDNSTHIKEIKTYDLVTVKKKIIGLCNKIGDKTYEKISQKIINILNEFNNEDLTTYTITTIIKTAMNLLTVLDKNVNNKYNQLQCYALVCKLICKELKNKTIVSAVFYEMLEDTKQNINAHKSKSVEEYFKKKKKLLNLFVFLAALYHIKFINWEYITAQHNYLYTKILHSSEEINNIYIPTFCVLQMNVTKQLSNKKQVQFLIDNAKYNKKCKFELLDLCDAIKGKEIKHKNTKKHLSPWSK
jgi:hypothetical protein